MVRRQVLAEIEALLQIPWTALLKGLRTDGLVAAIVGACF
jgi:hypothetical protein